MPGEISIKRWTDEHDKRSAQSNAQKTEDKGSAPKDTTYAGARGGGPELQQLKELEKSEGK